jgi:hypothetical protein
MMFKQEVIMLKRNRFSRSAMTNTGRRRKARQTAISEEAVIPLPQLRSEAVLENRNRKENSSIPTMRRATFGWPLLKG